MATRRIEIAPENQDQFAAWNGEEGEQWAADAEFFDAAIHHIHRRLMDAAAIRSDEQVLDIGCGTGQCTHDAARQARKGAAIGIDLSLPLLHVAETIAGRDGLANATFEQGDAQIFPFPDAAFDVALSRMGAMFFADQAAAFTNIAKAMRPGGRLLLISWRAAAENEWITQLREAMLPGAPAPEPPGDAPTPFRHADQHTTKVILEASGFDTVAFEPVTAPMFFGGDAEAGFPVLCRLLGWMVRDLEPDAARRAYRRLHTLLRDHETTDGVAFGSASWLITARGRHGFPDVLISVDKVVSDGDCVVGYGRITGTSSGIFFGMPPTGKSADSAYIDIYRIENDLITEAWHSRGHRRTHASDRRQPAECRRVSAARTPADAASCLAHTDLKLEPIDRSATRRRP